jgi:hypothetical protein
MKNIIYLLCLLCNIGLYAQSFLPFKSNARKLFRDDLGQTYSMVFQHAEQNIADSIFIPVLNISGNFFNSDSCVFWGVGCYKQNQSGWLGKKVKTNNASKYQFYKVNGDSLSFEFNQNINDTNLIYQDSIQILKMSYSYTVNTQILGYNDAVNYYNLYHTDLSGNPINSTLNQFQIAVGNNLGLINFFSIEHFPAQIKTLNLLGNQSPNVGFYRLTNEMLYDYAVGDEYQYYLGSSHSNFSWGWSTTDYSKYVKYTIINKSLTPDSLIYFSARNTINLLTNSQVTDSIYLRYARNQGIAGIPYEIFDGHYYKNFKLGQTCGADYWEFNLVNEPYNLEYCEIDTCWGGVDTQGPAANVSIKYVLGFGQTIYHDNLFGGINFTSHNITSDLIYSVKNGQPCGMQQFLSISENMSNTNQLIIAPNPANDQLFVTFIANHNSSNSILKVRDLQGRVLLQETFLDNQMNSSPNLIIDIKSLTSGIYFISFEKNGVLLSASKFIKN